MKQMMKITNIVQKQGTSKDGNNFNYWFAYTDTGKGFSLSNRTSGFEDETLELNKQYVVDTYTVSKDDGRKYVNAKSIQLLENLDTEHQLHAYIQCLQSSIQELTDKVDSLTANHKQDRLPF